MNQNISQSINMTNQAITFCSLPEMLTPPELLSLLQELANKLEEKQLMLASAESCTGGLIGALCTDLAGSSAWFSGGIISYTNALKTALLGVGEDVLLEHGAVSLPVVQAMAKRALKVCKADVAVAVSGIAGPSGGSAEKPVGTVCIAVAGQGFLQAQTLHFAGNRHAVRMQTAMVAFGMLLSKL